jgi:hypothetical protein
MISFIYILNNVGDKGLLSSNLMKILSAALGLLYVDRQRDSLGEANRQFFSTYLLINQS